MQVAIAVWFLAGVNRDRTVALSGKVLLGMGVSRNAGYRGLEALEAAGLVSAVRRRGRVPIVTILEPSG